MWAKKIVFSSILLLAALTSNAEDQEENKGPWSGNTTLGYLATSGNTESKSANFEFGVNYDLVRWHHGLSGRFFSSSQDNDATAENYQLSWSSKYDFSEFNYGVGRLNWQRDRFSSYDYQRFATLAYGRRIIKNKKHELDAEIGGGWSQSKTIVNEDISEAIFRLYGEYDWQITDTSKFSQTIQVSAGSSNTFTEAVTSLRLAIVGSLGLAVSFTYQNNSDVVPGKKKTDTITSIGLDYEF